MRQVASGIIVTLLLAICAPSVLASPPEPMTSVFFDTVKQFHPEPDNVELARYYVYHPEHASPLYAKAAQQDYVFIALLVAAKAARDQSIQGVGTFDYNTCMIPTKAFDAVFMKTGEFVQANSQNQYVKAYTQAGTQQAKDALSAQLAQSVPYWKEIPHICHFTFNTNLEKEKQMKQSLTSGVTGVKSAYEGFASGNIVGGVGALISAGVSGDVACSLADQMISGGFIGKVPVLGDLANSACAGFVGNVIKGVGTAGGAVIDSASNLGDIIAGQDQHMPTQAYYDQHWRPRVAEGADRLSAGTFGSFLKDMWEPCADYFDTHTMSRKNAQETCDHHRDAVFVPAVQATIAAREEAVRQREEFTREIPLWSNGFFQFWYHQCGDAACENKIKSLRDIGVNYAEAAKSSGNLGWPAVAGQLQEFHTDAAAEVAASTQRFVDFNKATTQNASLAWTILARDAWTPRCWDHPCRVEIDQHAKNLGAAARLLQMAHPDESSLTVQAMAAKEFAPKAQKSIDDSEGRRIIADPKASAFEKLPRLACKQFLGRSGDWLCQEQAGFNACVAYVKNGPAVHCRFPAGNLAYGTADQMTAALKPQSCTPSGSNYSCNTDKGKSECLKYRSAGMGVTCLGPGEVVLAVLPGNIYVAPPPAPPEQTSRGGRPAPRSRATTSRQITLVTKGGRPPRTNTGVVPPARPVEPNIPRAPAPIRIPGSDERKQAAAKSLTDQGCTAGRRGDFACRTDAAFTSCERYKGAGLVTACSRTSR